MLKRNTVLGFVAVVAALAAFAAFGGEKVSEDRQSAPPSSGDRDQPPPPSGQEGEKAAPRRPSDRGPGGLPPGQAPSEDKQRPGRPGFGGDGFYGERRFQPPTGPGRGIYPDWETLQKRDPELFGLMKQELDLERQTRDLLKDYRAADEAKRAEIKQQIQKLVEQHFDTKQQRRELELKRFENELKGLRERLSRRSQAREKIVEKHISDLLSREEEDEAGF
jgi:hypothetical protein